MAHLMDRARSHLVLVDLQEKLLPTIDEIDRVLARSRFLVETARALGVPVTVSEQYPKGLGPTEPGLLALCDGAPVIAKTAFSCLKDAALAARLSADPVRRQLVLVGIEAHVCVLQTALDAVAAGFDVFVASDAVSSRSTGDAAAGLARMAAAGVTVISAEMAFFEWLERSGTPEFKALSPLLR